MSLRSKPFLLKEITCQNNLSKIYLKNISASYFWWFMKVPAPEQLLCVPVLELPSLPPQLNLWNAIQMKICCLLQRSGLIGIGWSFTGFCSAQFWKQVQLKLLLVKVWWAHGMEVKYSSAWVSVGVSALETLWSKREEAKLGPEVVP